MSEFLTKAQEQFLIYRLLIGKIILTIFATMFLGYVATMAQVKWSALDWNERVYTICIIGALVCDKLIAFFDKTSAALAKGKLPIDDNGNTKEWKKIESNETKTINNP